MPDDSAAITRAVIQEARDAGNPYPQVDEWVCLNDPKDWQRFEREYAAYKQEMGHAPKSI